MLHRLYLVRSLSESARVLGFEDTEEHLIPILRDLMTEPEPSLRQALVEQIPEFTKYFIELKHEVAYKLILQILIPLVTELTTDRHLQVRSSAVESLIQVSMLIKIDDLETSILPIVKSLANDTTEEEHRLQAVQIITTITPLLNIYLFKSLLFPLICKLSDDRVFRVRKAIAFQIGDITANLNNNINNNNNDNKETEENIININKEIIEIFGRLCKDEIWGVRKACAESLVLLGKSIVIKNKEEKQKILVPMFTNLLEDESRWVRGSAYQNLGPFIAIFEGEEINVELIHYYTDMLSDVKQAKALGDGEVALYCAYNFPAVLYTVGISKWNLLQDTYFRLVKDTQWKVRRTLSFSLHEIAKIIGTSNTEEYLLNVFEMFLKDSDEVKEGIVTNIVQFLNILTMNNRIKYVNTIVDLKSSKNWRFRKLIAKQISGISKLYDINTTTTIIVPLVLHLCQDPFAKVRKVSSSGVGILLLRLIAENSTIKSEFERQLLSFATHATFHKRLLFLDICFHLPLQLESDYFLNKFVPKLITMQNDKIPNVRLQLVNVIANLLKIQTYENNKQLIEVLMSMQSDVDKEVRNTALQTYSEQIKKTKEEINNDNNNNNNNNNTSKQRNENIQIKEDVTNEEKKEVSEQQTENETNVQ